MSIKLMTAVWERSAHKGSELLVLLAIADNASDEARTAYPSIPYLAKKTRMTDRGVQKIIRRLVESGEVTIVPDSSKKSRTYRVNTDRMGEQNSPQTDTDVHPGDEPSDTPGVNHCSPVGVNHCSPKPSISNRQENRQRTDPPTPQGEDPERKPKELTDVQKMVERFREVSKLEKVSDFPKQAKFAKKLLDVGVTVDDIPALFAFVSWAHGADLGTMFSQVDKWRVSLASPPAASNGSGPRKRRWDTPNPYMNGEIEYWEEGMGPVSEKAEDWQALIRNRKPGWGKAKGGLDSLEDVGKP